ncbi:MAG TPA: M3 family oligoendopeptidase [Acidimicrobiales bacterium]|nr:M3 family oligoendopeptidase [Acidimicrobiales bacterium]
MADVATREGDRSEGTDVATVLWDLSDLLGGRGDDEAAVADLLDAADVLADELAAARGTVPAMSPGALAAFMHRMEELQELLGRAGAYASLQFATDTTDPARGARMQKVQERSTAMATKLIWFDLEWAALDDDHVARLLADPVLDFARHHLEAERRYRDHLLSEPEERILTEKSLTGRGAWTRLYSQEQSTIEVDLDGRTATLEEALSRLGSPERDVRKAAAEAITAGLRPGLRTRAFIFNTLMADKSIDDRLRGYDSWIASRNLANEASDESVGALVAAVRRRYDIPQRWYALKAKLLGLDRIADYDRMASVATSEELIGWDEAREVVLDAYASFSDEMASVARRFFDDRWIDAPPRPGKRGGAFCSYTVPSVHPYVFLNWTGRRRDVMTLAHELGHGLHAYLARGQGIFHQSTPLTVAETASVFGETVTFGRVLESVDDPEQRLSLLAANIEDAIATIFRQTAMNRFEERVHTIRREEGELSIERFGEAWAETQADMLGPAVEITEGYRTWWSYIPHFIHTPGYVYAYSYGQLLALSVYRQYEEQGSDFVPRYLHMLSAGGSMAPEDLGRIVGCDLGDAGFWDGGLDIVEQALEKAEQAAFEARGIS